MVRQLQLGDVALVILWRMLNHKAVLGVDGDAARVLLEEAIGGKQAMVRASKEYAAKNQVPA